MVPEWMKKLTEDDIAFLNEEDDDEDEDIGMPEEERIKKNANHIREMLKKGCHIDDKNGKVSY